MQQARDDPRSLRNNLNDIQAIITALQKQGETIEEMILRCNKDTLYFTRSTEVKMSSSESDSFDLNLDLINIAMRIDRMYSLLKTIQRDLEKIKQATIPNPPAATPHEEEKEKPSTSRQ
ncbi:hypothetical protein Y032_0053g2375 [Ancylostoma ceylanicum]|nr:hypothetical protein Y032_0053g2375 [Ancylostoma ceylanicum]